MPPQAWPVRDTFGRLFSKMATQAAANNAMATTMPPMTTTVIIMLSSLSFRYPK
jgi:hypothetical protein